MKGPSLGEDLLGGMLLLGLLYWLWMAFMAVLLPICIVSVVTSLRGILRELAALNAARGPAPAEPIAARATFTPVPAPPPAIERVGAPGRLIAP